jgi:hypothetical protein
MTNKKSLLLIAPLFLSSVIYAQNNFVAGGGTAIGSNGSVTYSVGQVPFQYQANSNYSIGQGLQQPFEIIPLSNDSFSTISLAMKAYPNPTSSILFLSTRDQDLTDLNYEITDINGRSIQKSTISNSETAIQCEDMAVGIYVLSVKKNSQLIKNFKLIKK